VSTSVESLYQHGHLRNAFLVAGPAVTLLRDSMFNVQATANKRYGAMLVHSVDSSRSTSARLHMARVINGRCQVN
jgi:hypothetical protein